MRVHLNYFAQIRQAAGADTAVVDLADNATVLQAMRAASERHGDAFRKMILDDAGRPQPSLILLVNGAPTAGYLETALKDGDAVSLFSPIAGG
ncbi:MAG: MoaD family protein [Verrucomicrobiota bacterium]|nr:MoaD family protein [Verrucomicrobiota bacterium]